MPQLHHVYDLLESHAWHTDSRQAPRYSIIDLVRPRHFHSRSRQSERKALRGLSSSYALHLDRQKRFTAAGRRETQKVQPNVKQLIERTGCKQNPLQKVSSYLSGDWQ